MVVSRRYTRHAVESSMVNGPGFPRPPGSAGGNDALQRAVLALNSQRPSEAERIAGDVLRGDPRHARALHIFGCALLMQGRAEDAVAPLESAARGRHDPEIETQLAIALHQSGRDEDALRRLKLATKRQPPYAPAFKELGYLLVSTGRYDEAIEVLSRGLEVAPMMPQLSIQLGYAFLSRRNCANAKVAFARALGLAPDSPDALFGMAKAHHELGENRPAAEYFRHYLRTRPSDEGACWNSANPMPAMSAFARRREATRGATATRSTRWRRRRAADFGSDRARRLGSSGKATVRAYRKYRTANRFPCLRSQASAWAREIAADKPRARGGWRCVSPPYGRSLRCSVLRNG
jgi:Flp pilus assembly protein TadD